MQYRGFYFKEMDATNRQIFIEGNVILLTLYKHIYMKM